MRETLLAPMPLTFEALFVFLLAASLAGAALARRHPESATIRNANDRIRAWWAITIILAIAFAAGTTATILLFALASFWCLREFLSLTPTRLADHYALAAAFYVFLPLQYALLLWPWLAVFVIAIPVYGFLALPSLSLAFGETTDFLQRVAKIQWALMLTVYALSHAPALLLLRFEDHAAGPFGLLAFLLLVTQGSDVAQYLAGKRFGRTPLAPAISPSKTREGLLYGGAAATLLGGALHGLTPFGVWGALAMALVLVAAGALGGLVLSAVKRSLGAKDWGTMIEGHGGMLDRMDSLAFSAPLLFHLANYFWAV
ncbi:phosphatidate cytidylyltransferase [Amaricoccus sp.]|uniref:phosphatidate cytidylyltransferase n=1 Tax=Amaricoccus sp. TaxID=1872485 RepID=UPI0025B95EA4|nr:phosphatidate cytidylyltransferase [Amaricoccus sp.]